MDKIQISTDAISSTTLRIGFQGENNHTQVVIYWSTLYSKYPSAVATMVINSPTGVKYPKTITQTGNKVIWNVTSADAAQQGNGEYQLTFTNGTEIIKTYIGSFTVLPSIIGSGTPPDPLEDWLEDAQQALDDFDQDVSDAEAWAVGTRNGVPVSSSDPTYHNNAKYWGDHLNIHVTGTTLVINP